MTTAANSEPELAALGTEWKAIGSAQLTTAEENTDINSGGVLPIFRLDGAHIGDEGLFWASLLAPLNIFQTGEIVPNDEYAWTGTSADGKGLNFLGLGSGIGLTGFGWPVAPNGLWLQYDEFGLRSSTELHFYGISGILTVPPVPEPRTMVLAGVGLAALAVFRLRRRR